MINLHIDKKLIVSTFCYYFSLNDDITMFQRVICNLSKNVRSYSLQSNKSVLNEMSADKLLKNIECLENENRVLKDKLDDIQLKHNLIFLGFGLVGTIYICENAINAYQYVKNEYTTYRMWCNYRF